MLVTVEPDSFEKCNENHRKRFGVTNLVYDAVVVGKPLVIQDGSALGANTKRHPVVHGNAHGDRMPHDRYLWKKKPVSFGDSVFASSNSSSPFLASNFADITYPYQSPAWEPLMAN